MKQIFLMLFAVALLTTACNDEQKSSTSTAEHHHEAGENHDHEANEHEDHDHGAHDHGSGTMENRDIKATTNKNSATGAIIDAYIQIKNGLASDDSKAAAQGGKALLSAFAKFDMAKLDKDTHVEYMDIVEDATEQAEHIVKSPMDHQREHFEGLSTDINDLIALLGTDKTLYQDFCPMANNGKGAIWISELEVIKNPFFGSKMPKCGKVQKKIN